MVSPYHPHKNNVLERKLKASSNQLTKNCVKSPKPTIYLANHQKRQTNSILDNTLLCMFYLVTSYNQPSIQSIKVEEQQRECITQ